MEVFFLISLSDFYVKSINHINQWNALCVRLSQEEAKSKKIEEELGHCIARFWYNVF